MTEQRRNIAVGLTVLIAMTGLGYMILLFGELPAFARPGYLVRIDFGDAGGLSAGADVRLNGLRIGSVAAIALRKDPRDGVRMDCRIDRDQRIPADIDYSLSSGGFGGGAYLALTTPAPDPDAPPAGLLPNDDSALLQRRKRSSGGGGLLGPDMAAKLDEITEAFASFGRLADNLNDILEGKNATDPPTGLAGTMAELDAVLKGIRKFTGDQENQENFKKSLANLSQAAVQAELTMSELHSFAAQARKSLGEVDRSIASVRNAADTTSKRVDELAGKLIGNADKLSELLTSLNLAARLAVSGRGSAGKFLNDPQLYDDLVESARQLALTLSEMQSTIRAWREDGLPIKLK